MSLPKDSLNIDKENLDLERSELPRKIFVWGEKLAKARAEAKRVKNVLKLKAAEIGRKARQNPLSYFQDGKAPSKDAVEEVVLLDGEYQKLQETLIETEEEQETLEMYLEALKDKAFGCMNLTELHGQQYWFRNLPNGQRKAKK